MIRRFVSRNSHRVVSKWLILIIDLTIILSSFLLAYLLRFNFTIPSKHGHTIAVYSVFILLASIVASLLTGSYTGIIRYSGFKDTVRLAQTMLIVGVVLVFKNYSGGFTIVHDTLQIPSSVIVIFLVLSMFFLTSFRTIIKHLFRYFTAGNGVKKNIVIIGAGQAGLTAKNVILTSTSGYNVKAFADDSHRKVGKNLEGVPVILTDAITEDYIRNSNIQEIIFAIQHIDPVRKKAIVDRLLEIEDVSLREVPPANKWIEGKLTERQIDRIHIEDLLQRSPIKLDLDHVKREIEGKTVMITGAAGSIGSEMARQLCHYGARRMIFLDQAETPLYELEQQLRRTYPEQVNRFNFQIADVSDRETLRLIFQITKPQLVYHAAAYKHVPMMEANPFSAVYTNVFGTRNLADIASEIGVEKFVMVSTDKAVNPTNVMGATKRLAEIYCQSMNSQEGNKTRFITTRFGNVLGSNGSVIPLFEKQIAAGGPVTVTHPDITRYFMTIPEACQLVYEAGAMGNGGEIYLFDMGEPVKIVDLARKMIRLSGLEPDVDIKISFSGLRPGEKLFEELLASTENSLTTHHPKITIAKVRYYPFSEVTEMLDRMAVTFKTYDTESLVLELKRSIPEYISNNSVYEKFDNIK